MNNFAQIKPLFQYAKVAYYSVVLNNEQNSLFEQFIKNHEVEHKEKLYHILKWIQQIGQNYGAQKRFFRNEANFADTSALPPKNKNLKPLFIEYGKTQKNNLRLYSLRANDKVVFLFGGGIKTQQKAQDCPNVSQHFELANKLTKAIDKAFIEKDIQWINQASKIAYDKNYQLKF